jgi:polysaccharide export outer membrane protein
MCLFLIQGLFYLGAASAATEKLSSEGQNSSSKKASEIAKSSSAKVNRASAEGNPASRPSDETLQEKDAYRLGVEDSLLISVWHETELSMPIVVRPDGMITLPLLNDIPVVGLTTKELQLLLTEKLKPFVNDPQVTVIVREIRSRKVYLVGKITHPGPYTLNGRKTVLQLLVEGGGVAPFAKTGSIYVLRQERNRQLRIPFNYKKALSGNDPRLDFALLPGDMLVVP